ncbi:MAG TPA: 6-phosphogluconolactonase [Rhodanobacteraceae bacterium]|nr:6-phosphogluconolactonase [Rhodanobacteraceae bacterium]
MNAPAAARTRWHPVADEASLQRAACAVILDDAARAIRERGRFVVVLAGGNTPRGVYHTLCDAPTDWSAWHIYFGDERCAPPDDPERNSRMAADTWLDHVPVPAMQIHAMPGELGARQGATVYARTLRDVGTFDLVLLGLGEDGHTASLFPGHDWGSEPDAPATLAVFDAPKPPPERISMSATRLADARHVVFLIAGVSKRQAVADWRAGKVIPASAIHPVNPVDVLLEIPSPDSA